MTDDRDLPLLQDTVDQLVWVSWDVEIDDLFIVNEHGMLVEIYNLMDHDLASPANMDVLEAKLKAAAGE